MLKQGDIRTQREGWFIECARVLLDEQGYEGMSMSGLAASASFTKRTLYQYFKNKREVYLAVVGSDLLELEGELQAVIGAGESGREKYLAMLGAFLGFVRQRPHAYERIFAFEEQDFHLDRPLARDDVHLSGCIEIHQRISRLTLGLIEEGQRDASISSERTATEIMLGVWAAMVGVIRVVGMRREQLGDRYSTSVDGMYEMLMGMISCVLDGEV